MKKTKSKAPSKDEIAQATAKGLLAAVPIAGGLLSEFFGLVIQNPANERINTWLQKLEFELAELRKENEQFKTENLAKNEQFNTTVISCVQMVAKTHYSEKLQTLHNIAIKSVDFKDNDYSLEILIVLVEQLSPAHILKLTELNSFSEALDQNESASNYLLKELESKGVIYKKYEYSMPPIGENQPMMMLGKFRYELTVLGVNLLSFIKESKTGQ